MQPEREEHEKKEGKKRCLTTSYCSPHQHVFSQCTVLVSQLMVHVAMLHTVAYCSKQSQINRWNEHEVGKYT